VKIKYAPNYTPRPCQKFNLADFYSITAKNADQKLFFFKLYRIDPLPLRGGCPKFAKKIGPLWSQKLLFHGNLAIFAKWLNHANLPQTL
jgi:hypothetical protein